eukprot:8190109-Prorocentrum_lima.AAC.1
MTSSLVGSEMCIRDSIWAQRVASHDGAPGLRGGEVAEGWPREERVRSVSYTHLTLPTICSV